jgi:hypothetical protein
MNPIHTSNRIYRRPILILSSHICFGLPSDPFPSGFLSKILYAYLIDTMRATCLAHLIHSDLIILITFGEEYNKIILIFLACTLRSCKWCLPFTFWDWNFVWISQLWQNYKHVDTKITFLQGIIFEKSDFTSLELPSEYSASLRNIFRESFALISEL